MNGRDDLPAEAERFLSLVKRYQSDRAHPATATIWSPELECAPRATLRAIQEEKLAAAFDYLFACSPYYRERFTRAGLGPSAIRTLDDLKRVPITRLGDWVSDIEQAPPWGTFSPLSQERFQRDGGWMVFSTSGTTRTPRLFRHTLHDREMWGWMAARALWSYGVRRGDIAMNCFFSGPSVAAWGMNEGLARLGCTVIPAGAVTTERRVLFIKLMRPQVLLGTASTLTTLATTMKELGHDPAAAGVRTLVCAGEPGAAVEATRARLRERWGGAQVHDDFGCTEVAMAPLGYTCQHEATRESGPIGVHLMEDALIVEVLDPDSLKPVPRGELGTLVVSNLYSEASPFLRVDLGDWVRVTDEPCGCGRTHARAIGGLLGRNDHCLKIKGLKFFPSTFEDALRSIPGVGDEYRIEVHAAWREGSSLEQLTEQASEDRRVSRDEVHVIIEPQPDVRLNRMDLERRLRGVLGISVMVDIRSPGTLPRTEGKGQRFKDLRQQKPVERP